VDHTGRMLSKLSVLSDYYNRQSIIINRYRLESFAIVGNISVALRVNIKAASHM